MSEPREDEISVRYSMLDSLLLRARRAEAKLDTHYLIPKELIDNLRGSDYTDVRVVKAVLDAAGGAK